MHHVGILYDQFMMHGQRNIKLNNSYVFISWHFAAMAINTRPVKSLNIHNHLLVVTTDGNTRVNFKMAEIDVSSKQWAQIKFLVSIGDKLIKIFLKCMVKLLWMWVMFSGGEEEENYVTNHRVVTLALQ